MVQCLTSSLYRRNEEIASENLANLCSDTGPACEGLLQGAD